MGNYKELKNKLVTFFTLLFVLNLSAQECNCTESFEWMVTTFEKNDAGFNYVVDKKGVDDYNRHTLFYKEKAKNTSTVNDCQLILNDWLHYFRKGHIGIFTKGTNTNTVSISNDEIRKQYKNEKIINLTESELIQILNSKQQKNPIEGIWSNGDYKIGVIQHESEINFQHLLLKQIVCIGCQNR